MILLSGVEQTGKTYLFKSLKVFQRTICTCIHHRSEDWASTSLINSHQTGLCELVDWRMR